MIPWWMEKAAIIQQKNREDELYHDGIFTGEQVNRAIVYTREDMGLLIGLVDALNQQTAMIKVILTAILIALCYIAVRMTFLH